MRYLILCFFVLVVGCNQPEKKVPSSSLRIGLSQDLATLDPRLNGERAGQVVSYLLFDGLTRIGEDGEAHLSLAKEMILSADGKIYTFKLKETLWSNGDPVTAYDFEHAWKKAISSEFETPYASRFDVILNASKARAGETELDEVGIRAVDKETFVVVLEHPAPYFPRLLASAIFFPVSSTLDEMEPRWGTHHDGVVSNGPFRLVCWEAGQQIRLEKNPYYWDKEVVTLKGVDLLISTDPDLLLTAFSEGKIDWLGEPLATLPSGVEDLNVQPIAGVYRYHFNVESMPFTSAKIRRSFAYSLDRPTLIDTIFDGNSDVATSVLPPNLSYGGDPLLKGPSRADAQLWFEEGLKELGISRKEFPTVVLTYRSDAIEQGLAQAVQKQWQEVLHIEVKLEGYEAKIYRTNLTNSSFQIAGATWFSWFEDPIYTLEQFKSAEWPHNVTLWENDEYTHLLDASDQEVNPDSRDLQLKEAENLVMSEMPVIPLYVATYKYLARPEVRGVIMTTSGHIDFKYASKDLSGKVSTHEKSP